jgi:hypothetical protein
VLHNNPVRLNVGYEGTPIGDAVALTGYPLDNLHTVKHWARYKHDFDLQEYLHIKKCRYPINWALLINGDGKLDFSVYDPIVEDMFARGFEVTFDLVHHRCAYQIEHGFSNPDFPKIFTDYAMAFKEHYPDAKHFTLLNEPGITAYLHCDGTWGNQEWKHVFPNMMEAIVMGSHALIDIDPEIQFYLPEPMEHAEAADPADREVMAHVSFINDIARFAVDELLNGLVHENHPFFTHSVKEGVPAQQLLKFHKQPAVKYIRCFDIYPFNFSRYEKIKGNIVKTIAHNPMRIKYLKEEFQKRVPGLKVSIAETNIRGTVEDRITWCGMMLDQAAEAGITDAYWWGLTDAHKWGDGNFTSSLLPLHSPADPNGIFPIKDHPQYGYNWERIHTEFSQLVRAYNAGQIGIEDFPLRPFTGEYAGLLDGFERMYAHRMQPATKTTAAMIAIATA